MGERASQAVTGEDGLVRALSHRQIQLMAIGGAIGVGLFLGAGQAIRDAGPAVLLCYLLAGAVVFLILRALGEMAVEHPISGSFARYAGQHFGPWASYATGWTYWLMWTVTVMAEVTAVGIYVGFFFPEVPQWLPALASVLTLVGANLVSVRVFGETEFWFALIKIVAILAFIASGLAIVFLGLGNLAEASVSNLWSHGGFFPNGLDGMLTALQIVTYAFLGIELIGVTAGEARDPERELPTAINRAIWRILLFYVGAVAVILMLIPWDQVSAETSPFVLAWESIGIGAAAGILNGVVITSALSSSNSGIFASARMLYSLSGEGEAPRRLRRLNGRRVPARALLVTAVALALGVLVNVLAPEKAFTYITSVATVAILWVWGVIAVSHLRFRRRAEAGARGRFPMPGSPWTNYLILAYLALVTVLLAVTPDQRVAIAAGAVWAAVLALGWWRISRRRRGDAERPGC